MRLGVLLLLGLGACVKKELPEPPPVAQPVAAPAPVATPVGWPGTDDGRAMYRAMSVRDPAPDCLTAEALVSDPLAALLEVVELAELPPYAPMRAAQCVVVHHAEEAADALVAWVGDPETAGLGMVALQGLEGMSEPTAVRVTEAALAGPVATDAREAAAASSHAGVRALVAQ